jgi:hypothetical protein
MVNHVGGGGYGRYTLGTAQLGFTPLSQTSLHLTRILIRPRFLYNYFVTREDYKAVFPIHSDTSIPIFSASFDTIGILDLLPAVPFS